MGEKTVDVHLKEYGTKGSWPIIGYYPRICMGGNENYHGKPVRLRGVLVEFEPAASHAHDRSVVSRPSAYVSRIAKLHDHSL